MCLWGPIFKQVYQHCNQIMTLLFNIMDILCVLWTQCWEFKISNPMMMTMPHHIDYDCIPHLTLRLIAFIIYSDRLVTHSGPLFPASVISFSDVGGVWDEEVFRYAPGLMGQLRTGANTLPFCIVYACPVAC